MAAATASSSEMSGWTIVSWTAQKSVASASASAAARSGSPSVVTKALVCELRDVGERVADEQPGRQAAVARLEGRGPPRETSERTRSR